MQCVANLKIVQLAMFVSFLAHDKQVLGAHRKFADDVRRHRSMVSMITRRARDIDGGWQEE